MILDYYAIKAQIQALAEQQGLHLVYNGNQRAFTDGKQVSVPTPRPDFTEDELTIWQMLVYHEIGHNMPITRDCFDVMKKHNINTKNFFGSVFNLLEDHRQEYLNSGVYLGRDAVMGRGHRLYLDTNKKKLEQNPDEILALMMFDAGVRASWQPEMLGWSIVITPEAQDYIDKLNQYQQELLDCNTAEDVYKLTRKIFEEVFQQDPDEAQQSEIQEVQTSGGVVKYSDILLHQHDQNQAKSEYQTNEFKILYDTEDSGYIPNDPEFLEFSGRYDNNVLQKLNDISSTHSFADKVRSLLQAYKQTRWLYGQKKGKLNQRSLYKIKTQQEPKIYKQRQESLILDSAVTVLMDFSGSMRNQKFFHAGHSMLLLNDLSQKIQVPMELLGFSTTGDQALHAVLKPFGEQIHQEELKRRLAELWGHAEANADGESILWAYSRLQKQKHTKKVMIVLSDGSPAHRDGIDTFTKEVCSAVQAKIDLYGIGILDSNVTRLYTWNRVIQDVHELEDALLEVLKEKILGVGGNV